MIDEQIEQWSAVGVRVAFRITCMENGGYDKRQYFATPRWVLEAGAEGKFGEYGWEPNFDDPIFLTKLENFHKAFAARYDGNPNVVYVDIGSLGVWGEGHTLKSSQNYWELDTVRKHCDIYLRYYKNTQLVVNDEMIGYVRGYEGQRTMLSYLKGQGVTIRDDSIGGSEQTTMYENSVESPEYFEQFKNTAPIILECEHFDEMMRDNTWMYGRILEGAIKQCSATYVGFHGDAENFLYENLGVAEKLANQMGYWFFVDELSTAENNERLNLNLKICNRGAAVAYEKYKLMLYLTDAVGNRTEYSVDSFDATTATPEMVKEYSIDIDTTELAKGSYTVGIRMSDHTDRPIYLALEGADADGYYVLADIEI